MFSEYARYYFDYECNEPLVANAKLTATSSLRERGPDNAKLYGKFIQNLVLPYLNTIVRFDYAEVLLASLLPF